MDNNSSLNDFIELLKSLPEDNQLKDVITSCWENEDLYSLSVISHLLENDAYILFFEGILSQRYKMPKRAIECFLRILMIQTDGGGLNADTIADYIQQLEEISPERILISQTLAQLKNFEEYKKEIRKVERILNKSFSLPDNESIDGIFQKYINNESYGINFLSYESMNLFIEDSFESFNNLKFGKEAITVIQSQRYLSYAQSLLLQEAVIATLEGDEELLMQANDDFVIAIIKAILLLDTDKTDKLLAVQMISKRFEDNPHIDNNIISALYFRFIQDIFTSANNFPANEINYNSLLTSIDELETNKSICSWVAYYISVLNEFIISANTTSITDPILFEFPTRKENMIEILHFIIQIMKNEIDDQTDENYIDQINKFFTQVSIDNNLESLVEKISEVIDPIDPDVLSLLLLLNGQNIAEANLLFETIEEEDQLELIILMRFVKIKNDGFGTYLGEKLLNIKTLPEKKAEVYATLLNKYPALKIYIRKETTECVKAYQNIINGK